MSDDRTALGESSATIPQDALGKTRVDYRRSYWGHMVEIKRNGKKMPDGTPMFVGHCFFRPPSFMPRRLAVGDELIVAMDSGRDAIFVVDAVRTSIDPGDQHFITCHPTHYLDEEQA